MQRYQVTDAAAHDSPVFDVLVGQHTGAGRHKRPIYADSADRPKARQERCACHGMKWLGQGENSA